MTAAGKAGGVSRRRRLVLLALMICALLAGFGWWIVQRTSAERITARPALWHLVREDREAFLLGTIHVVPRETLWLGPAIAQATDRSDRLILEVTGLEAERQGRAIFTRLGSAPGLPPLAARLALADAARLRTLIDRDPDGLSGLDGYRSWAAALLINAVTTGRMGLSADDAPEQALTRRFAGAGKPIAGLETIAGQLGLFNGLPEADQRRLLTQSIREADDAPALYRQLYTAWARGDLPRLEAQFLAPLSQAPALRAVLVDRRNADWAEKLDHDLRRTPGTAFIAVGAGHLVGHGNLIEAMQARGWRIARLQ